MKPIPVSWLIHVCTLSTTARDDYGNETDVQPVVNLRRVRLEPSAKRIVSKDNTEIQCLLTLFADMRNSLPQGTVPAVGQVIGWNGGRYRVATVERLYDRGRLHHVEAGLAEV